MSCQKCSSKRVLSISGKCSDLCSYSLDGKEPSGDYQYVPKDMGVGGGDYLAVDICLDCGQAQGKWPRPKTEFESELEERESDPFKVGDYVEFDQHGQILVGCVEEYDRDNMEVTIDVAGTWTGEKRNRLGPIPYYNGRAQRSMKVDQDNVKKTDKEW